MYYIKAKIMYEDGRIYNWGSEKKLEDAQSERDELACCWGDLWRVWIEDDAGREIE